MNMDVNQRMDLNIERNIKFIDEMEKDLKIDR